MNEKKYLAKIIAKDPNGLQVISACCSEGNVKIEIDSIVKNKDDEPNQKRIKRYT